MAAVGVRVAGLALPKEFDVRDFISKLNRIQDFCNFDYVGSSETIDPPDLPRGHHSLGQLLMVFKILHPESSGHRFDLGLTGEKIEDDYFSKVANHHGLISSADTDLILKESRKSLAKFLAFNIAETLLRLQYGHEHDTEDPDVGCLFDSCYYNRSNIISGLEECNMCAECGRILRDTKHVPREQLEATAAILHWVRRPPASIYLKWLSSAALLVAGGALIFVSQLTNVGVISLTLSGWVAAIPDVSWHVTGRGR